MTSDPTDIPPLRIPLNPNGSNRLDEPSRILIDKVTTIRRSGYYLS
jgi:mRNA interferase MazF